MEESTVIQEEQEQEVVQESSQETVEQNAEQATQKSSPKEETETQETDTQASEGQSTGSSTQEEQKEFVPQEEQEQETETTTEEETETLTDSDYVTQEELYQMLLENTPQARTVSEEDLQLSQQYQETVTLYLDNVHKDLCNMIAVNICIGFALFFLLGVTVARTIWDRMRG